MKTIITAAALAAIMIASPASAQVSDETKLSLCTTVGKVARQVMTWRQSEVPISKVLAANDKAGGSPLVVQHFKVIVMTAYNRPAYGSEEFRQREIERFGNSAEVNCLEAWAMVSEGGEPMKTTMQVTWMIEVEVNAEASPEEAATLACQRFIQGAPTTLEVRDQAGIVHRINTRDLDFGAKVLP